MTFTHICSPVPHHDFHPCALIVQAVDPGCNPNCSHPRWLPEYRSLDALMELLRALPGDNARVLSRAHFEEVLASSCHTSPHRASLTLLIKLPFPSTHPKYSHHLRVLLQCPTPTPIPNPNPRSSLNGSWVSTLSQRQGPSTIRATNSRMALERGRAPRSSCGGVTPPLRRPLHPTCHLPKAQLLTQRCMPFQWTPRCPES